MGWRASACEAMQDDTGPRVVEGAAAAPAGGRGMPPPAGSSSLSFVFCGDEMSTFTLEQWATG
ncbi:hypothetical protein QQ054_14865 [Oscillatoria amoena NRMC-F 0135]|nr:hypothetical protein [Oscillatoria amoena NRMC-F 0135]